MKKTFTSLCALIIVFGFVISPAVTNQASAEIGVVKIFRWLDPLSTLSTIMIKAGLKEGMGFFSGAVQSSVQDEISQLSNTGAKMMYPQVAIDFSASKLTDGQEVIATATPSYFMNDPNGLYYTWYLKHNLESGPKEKTDLLLNKTIKCDGHGNCDLNDDGKINPEDWKIEAARLIANNGFDWQNAITSRAYSSSDGKSSYEAVFGGDDQRGRGNDKCFFHDAASGKDFDLGKCAHLFPDDGLSKAGTGNDKNPKLLGNDYFGLDREKFWHTDPKSTDTAGTGHTDEANVIGLGQSAFKWNYSSGDEIGVAVEGVATNPTLENNASYRVVWALSKNTCEIGKDMPNSSEYSEFVGPNKTVPDKPGLLDNLGDPVIASDPTADNPGDPAVHAAWATSPYNPDFAMPSAGYTYTATSTYPSSQPLDLGTDPVTGDTTSITTQVVKVEKTGAVTSTTITNTETKTVTHHLSDINGNYTTQDITQKVTENILPTDTAVRSADVTINTIISTDHVDRNGAHSNQTFAVHDSTATETKHFELFSGTVSNLNDCLEKNLVSPTEGNAVQKLDIALSHQPEIPMNDPTGANSSTLEVSAAVSGSDDPSLLRYAWTVFQTSGLTPDGWNSVLKPALINSGPTSGMGVDKLSFDLQLPTSTTFIKVDLTITNQNDSSSGKHVSTIIPVSSYGNKIDVHSSDINVANLSLGALRCDTGKSLTNCPVAKDEIIGLRIDPTNLENFRWTIDGTPFTYSECFFEGLPTDKKCDPAEQLNFAYFPILKNAGETYTVGLSATKKDTHTSVSIVRNFQVVNPALMIVPGDSTIAPVLLGNYADLNGALWPDLSTTDFQAVSGTVIKVKPAFNTPFIDIATIRWTVDGQAVPLASDGTLTFKASKSTGTSYGITATGRYAQPNVFKNFLNKYWGVQLNQFYELPVDHSISIDMVDSLNGVSVSSATGQKKFLAAILTSLPEYLIFLFRIVLTAFLMLFTIWILFSLFPSYNESTDRSED